ncbi:MAG: hypothetical protein HQK91_10995, partial [Nitrospirae bacterium]|nr:hypothetical protein [Nitrospirota bacterium]
MIILYIPKPVSALEPVVISDKNAVYPLGRSLEYLEDKDKKWTIKDISSKEFDSKFIKSNTDIPNIGTTASAYWVRFKVNNKTDEIKDWLLEVGFPVIDIVELYTLNKGGEFNVIKSGNLIPVNKRVIKHRKIAFPIELSNGKEEILYMRFEAETADIILEVNLMSRYSFLDNSRKDYYIQALFFGFILSMIIYNFFLFINLKDLAYLYYVLFESSLLIFQNLLFGFFQEFITPNFVLTDDILVFCVFGYSSLGLLFTKTFLDTKKFSPKINQAILLFLFIYLIFFISFEFFHGTIKIYMVQISVLIFVSTVLIASISSLISGNKTAKYFITAWLIFLFSVVIKDLMYLTILPNIFLIEYSVQFGTIIETILLSLALADRIKVMQSENTEFKLKAETEISKIQKLESLALLAEGMAHDLNNILTGLFMKVQLSERIIKKDINKAIEYLSDVKNIFHMAINIINRLQTFSRGDALFIKQESLSTLLSEAGNLVLSGSNSQCEVTILKDLWAVEFDKTQLNQVITNLLINADQAMPNGGKINIIAENIEKIDNSIPSLTNDKYIKITIKDNGIGISKENIHKIFDPFFTTKESGQGLGLAMSYSIVKKHKGHIEVESEVGKGTSFYIYLPASESEQIEEEQELIPDQWQLLGKSILIMDD